MTASPPSPVRAGADGQPPASAELARRPHSVGFGVRACLLLAAAGAAAGLGLRLAVPAEAPEAAFLARVERWKILASTREREHPAVRP